MKPLIGTKRSTGMLAALCLLPFVPDSRPLAAVVGGALGLLLGRLLTRAVFPAVETEQRLRASAEQRRLRGIVTRRMGRTASGGRGTIARWQRR